MLSNAECIIYATLLMPPRRHYLDSFLLRICDTCYASQAAISPAPFIAFILLIK